MTWIAGADGYNGGWILALRNMASCELVIRAASTIAEVLAWSEAPAAVGVDIPIGLLDEAAPGGRACDKAARDLLGQPRARSVFSPPARPALMAQTFEEALRLSRESSQHHIGISRQCFHIMHKIREVDALMTPPLQERVLEVHPEVTFYELNGRRPVIASKKSKAGLRTRIELLTAACRWESPEGTLADIIDKHRSTKVKPDDIVDAIAACWTAERVLAGRAERLPPEPPRDARGLRMEIVR